MQRPRQLTALNLIMVESISSVQIKFCVDTDWLDFIIDRGFIDDFLYYVDLYDGRVRLFLESVIQENKDDETIEAVDEIGEKDLQTCMIDSNARFRVENLVT